MSRAGRSAESGFTLLEALLVLTVLALAGTIVGVAWPGTQDRLRLAEAASRVTSLLVEARSDARRTGETRLVVFDLDARRMTIRPSATWQSLPEGIELSIVSARELGSARQPAVAFLGNGTSSGGSVTLVSGSLQVAYRIEWLTGRVRDEGP